MKSAAGRSERRCGGVGVLGGEETAPGVGVVHRDIKNALIMPRRSQDAAVGAVVHARARTGNLRSRHHAARSGLFAAARVEAAVERIAAPAEARVCAGLKARAAQLE